MSNPLDMHAVVTIYGVPSCERVKNAKAWFSRQGRSYVFYDLKKLGLEQSRLNRWLQHLPWDALLNRQGTTWRQLPREQRETIVDQRSAIELMLAKPTIIKRPIVEIGDRIIVGFYPEMYL